MEEVIGIKGNLGVKTRYNLSKRSNIIKYISIEIYTLPADNNEMFNLCKDIIIKFFLKTLKLILKKI